MGLADRQRLLARLATDADLCDRLLTDPAATVESLQLQPADAAWLAALPGPDLAIFAGSLVAKRRGEVAKLLPGTARALGRNQFATLFRDHAAQPIPDGLRKHRQDAMGFAHAIGANPTIPPWVQDLARLEASALQARDPAQKRTVCRIGHRPTDLATALDSGKAPGRRPTLVIWFRVTGRGRLHRVILSRPW